MKLSNAGMPSAPASSAKDEAPVDVELVRAVDDLVTNGDTSVHQRYRPRVARVG